MGARPPTVPGPRRPQPRTRGRMEPGDLELEEPVPSLQRLTCTAFARFNRGKLHLETKRHFSCCFYKRARFRMDSPKPGGADLPSLPGPLGGAVSLGDVAFAVFLLLTLGCMAWLGRLIYIEVQRKKGGAKPPTQARAISPYSPHSPHPPHSPNSTLTGLLARIKAAVRPRPAVSAAPPLIRTATATVAAAHPLVASASPDSPLPQLASSAWT